MNIIAGVCLLLWGVTLLRLGVTRGFGAGLRRVLAASTANRFTAFGAGTAITALLQSSTATVLIVSAFAGHGMVSASSGLAIVLGADVGTTLVAQMLSFDLSLLMPVLMVAGYIAFSMEHSGKIKNMGRIMVGLALMLLALGLIRHTAEPLKDSEILPLVLGPLDKDPFFAVIIVAVLTWLMHSSLAMVLLLISFSAGGIVHMELALYMVLGANLGGIMPPLLATLRDHPQALRIPLGNAFIRVAGVVVLFFSLPLLYPYLALLGEEPARQIVNFHTVFNLGLAIVFLPFTPLIGRLCIRLAPDRTETDDPGIPRYLHEKDLDIPSTALAWATRETLRMADIVQTMLENTILAFRGDNERLVARIREEDDTLDSLYKAIKSYMAKLSREIMDEKEAQRYMQVLTFATNLEHVGDVIDKNLMPLADKKIRGQHRFSNEGFKEIESIHALVMESVKLAQSVFVSEDKELARKLLQDKDKIRRAEAAGMAAHITRLREDVPETLATSSLHIDIIRDLRRINTYMCTVAYPVLEEGDERKPTHLRVKRPDSG